MKSYLLNEDAATLSVEMVLLTLGIVALAGFLIVQVTSALKSSSEKSSCANGDNVFCQE